jgi:phospholipid transport system substrate-binding protein
LISRRNLLSAAVVLCIGVAALAPVAAAAADPATLITDMSNQALAVLGKNVSPSQRDARFRELFNRDFDVPAIARFVLGRYWRIATPAQQQEFVRLFAVYTAFTYSNRLAAYSGETLRVTGSQPEPDGPIVTSEIVRRNGAPPTKVDWRLSRTDGTYKITDVIVDGISMAVTQRSEFASVIQPHGGQVQGLLALLRQKNEAVDANP